MPSFAELIQQGATYAWLFMPAAIALGALHGLEPGHSKTMMAAFIVAIRGTAFQALLLGLAATFSHTLVVWAVAMGGLYLGGQIDAETSEPYFQMASAVLIIIVAFWMIWRTWRDQREERRFLAERQKAKARSYSGEVRHIDTGHGMLTLELYRAGGPGRWRVHAAGADHAWAAKDIAVETERADGSKQTFAFARRDGQLESLDAVAEPYEFMVKVSLSHGDHVHDFDVAFVEGLQAGAETAETKVGSETEGFHDAHQKAHADDIRRRFAGRSATTGQIVMFGLTGGLIPCPAAITVLLLCLQLREITLGAVLVLCFSIGLALVLVGVGVVAALSVDRVSKKWSGFDTFTRRAPYFSSLLIIAVGLYMGVHGWNGLAAQGERAKPTATLAAEELGA
jgi:nickel/cobalt exporter